MNIGFFKTNIKEVNLASFLALFIVAADT